MHVEHLQLLSEDHSKILINSLNLDIFEGMRVLITGSVASGKSTLIRLLARDSTQFSGDILWNIHSQDIVACPQNPYCFMVSFSSSPSFES